MSKFLCAALTALTMSVAHSAPSEAQYDALATFRADLQVCYEDGQVTPHFFAASDRAVDIILAIVSFDREKLHGMTMAAWQRTSAYPELCRDTEVSGYQLQSRAEQMKANHNEGQRELREAARNFGNSQPPNFLPQQPTPVIVCRPGYFGTCR
ncbi:hypothetical protein LJR175_008369 [Variovorax sp. LjRoot175]|uniref:hypothetical protein n=1 Tax=Variovorax sp. LjRoot175 TaxID=3342276 RepID=UPI003ECC57C6